MEASDGYGPLEACSEELISVEGGSGNGTEEDAHKQHYKALIIHSTT